MIRVALLGVLVLAAPAAAEPRTNGVRKATAGDMEIDAGLGVARMWSLAARNSVAFDAGIGVYARPARVVALRGHVDVGRGPSAMTSLGIELRCEHHRWFVGSGPAIVHVRDAVDALAMAIDVRGGITLGHLRVVADAMPMWAFANDAVDATMDGAIRLGVGLGYDFY